METYACRTVSWFYTTEPCKTMKSSVRKNVTEHNAEPREAYLYLLCFLMEHFWSFYISDQLGSELTRGRQSLCVAHTKDTPKRLFQLGRWKLDLPSRLLFWDWFSVKNEGMETLGPRVFLGCSVVNNTGRFTYIRESCACKKLALWGTYRLLRVCLYASSNFTKPISHV